MASLKKRGKYYYGRWQKTENGKSIDVKKSLKLTNKKLAGEALETLEELEEHGEIDPYHSSFDPVQALKEEREANKSLNIYSVRTAADHFYKSKSHLSSASVNNKEKFTMNTGGTYQRVIEYFIKKNDVADLSPLLIKRHHFDRVIFRDGIKASTMHFYFRQLRVWWNKLLEWGVVKRNYIAEIQKDLPTVKANVKAKMISEEELNILFKTFNKQLAKKRKQKHWNDSQAQYWFKPLMAVYFYTGLRRNEAAYKKGLDYSGLKYDNLIFENGSPVIINLSSTKGPRERAVPIPKPCQIILSDYLERRGKIGYGDYIFVYAGGRRKGFPVKGKRAYKIYKDYLKMAGIPNSRTLHGMRHKRVTTWLENGYSTSEAQFMAGHSSSKTTEKYTHLTGKNLLDKMRRMENS